MLLLLAGFMLIVSVGDVRRRYAHRPAEGLRAWLYTLFLWMLTAGLTVVSLTSLRVRSAPVLVAAFILTVLLINLLAWWLCRHER